MGISRYIAQAPVGKSRLSRNDKMGARCVTLSFLDRALLHRSQSKRGLLHIDYGLFLGQIVCIAFTYRGDLAQAFGVVAPNVS